MTNAAADPNPNYRFRRWEFCAKDQCHLARYELTVRMPGNAWLAVHRDVEKDSDPDVKQIERELHDLILSRYKKKLRTHLRRCWFWLKFRIRR